MRAFEPGFHLPPLWNEQHCTPLLSSPLPIPFHPILPPPTHTPTHTHTHPPHPTHPHTPPHTPTHPPTHTHHPTHPPTHPTHTPCRKNQEGLLRKIPTRTFFYSYTWPTTGTQIHIRKGKVHVSTNFLSAPCAIVKPSRPKEHVLVLGY